MLSAPNRERRLNNLSAFNVDFYSLGDRFLSWVATKLGREVLFGFVAIFSRELVTREVRKGVVVVVVVVAVVVW